MDVRQKEIASLTHDPHIVLDMQSDLKVIAPVAAVVSVVGENRIVEENLQAIEIRPEAIQHHDVWRDKQEISGEAQASKRAVCHHVSQCLLKYLALSLLSELSNPTGACFSGARLQTRRAFLFMEG